jgi:hypothetical protein
MIKYATILQIDALLFQDEAANEKNRIEEKQRDARKNLVKKEKPHPPR